ADVDVDEECAVARPGERAGVGRAAPRRVPGLATGRVVEGLHRIDVVGADTHEPRARGADQRAVVDGEQAGGPVDRGDVTEAVVAVVATEDVVPVRQAPPRRAGPVDGIDGT